MNQVLCVAVAGETPTPATATGGWRRSRARSRVVRTYAVAPSEINAQSGTRSGSATVRAASYPARSRASGRCAPGVSAAWARACSAIAARPSSTGPSSWA
ncbi:hypothetical protein [Nocardioides humi]|uniref:hypothetical protein n=1 Tax=Nocardioides humi TaxID=449461 RepID=UPI001129B9D8|nr:hypothetical protein [Nocardioides humi]